MEDKINYLRSTIEFADFHKYDVGLAVTKYSLYQTDLMKDKPMVIPSQEICKQAHEKIREKIIETYR